MMGQTGLWSALDARPFPAQQPRLKLFALDASHALGEAVSAALGQPLASHEEREFADAEHKGRPLESVAGADVFVLQSLHSGPSLSANDKLCRLLFFIGACKDAGAARVTAVTPYLCYARKDRRTKPSDPVTSRYVAVLFEAVGADALVALEVHNPAAFENAFRGRTVALASAPLFVSDADLLGAGPLCVVSPDPGGAKRAEQFRLALETVRGEPVGKGFIDKHRSADVLTGHLFVGEAVGTTAVIVDDLISSGATLLHAARAARKAGARRVIALVAHGLFMPGADEALADPAIDALVVSDVVPPFRLETAAARRKLRTVAAAPLLAEAVRRLHEGRLLTDLMTY